MSEKDEIQQEAEEKPVAKKRGRKASNIDWNAPYGVIRSISRPHIQYTQNGATYNADGTKAE